MKKTNDTQDECLQCTICKKRFVYGSSLKHHLRRHEENNETEDGQFVKFIAENFDMKCDHCDVVFEGFHNARQHYKEAHGDNKGYLKCCNDKLREPWMVKDHVLNHLNPDTFK